MDPEIARNIVGFIARLARRRYGLVPDDCEDLAQEVLIAFWKKFPKQEPSLPWAARAMHLTYLQSLRAESRRTRREAEFVRRRAASQRDEVAAQDLRLDLLTALGRLVGRDPLPAGDDYGANLREIARQSGIPVGTLYRRLWEGRKRSGEPPKR